MSCIRDQRVQGHVRCIALGAEVPGQHPEKLMKTLIVHLLKLHIFRCSKDWQGAALFALPPLYVPPLHQFYRVPQRRRLFSEHTSSFQVPCEDVAMRIPIPECWIYQFRQEKHHVSLSQLAAGNINLGTRMGSVKSAHRRAGKVSFYLEFMESLSSVLLCKKTM